MWPDWVSNPGPLSQVPYRLPCAVRHLLSTPEEKKEDNHVYVQSKLPYFFGYKTELFFFQNNLKDLDPSCKTDLDLLDCLGRVNLEL